MRILLAFLLFLNRSKNKQDIYKATNDFIKMFHNDTLENDEILKTYLVRNLNTNSNESNKIKKLIKLLY